MPPSKLVTKVRRLGIKSAAVHDLIAIGFSRREADVDQAELASQTLLRLRGNLQSLVELSPAEIEPTFGLDEFEWLRCQALMDLGRRIASVGKGVVETITGPEDVARLLDRLQIEKQEYFVTVMLDAKNKVLRTEDVHIGTLNASLVGVREVFRGAIKEGASSIIVAHNHPSGDPTPSPEDIAVTKRLREAGELLDIPVVDHVIIGDGRITSFARQGLL